MCNLKSFKSIVCLAICKEPNGKSISEAGMRQWSLLGPFRNCPSPPTTCQSGVPWIPRFMDLVSYTKGLTPTVPCFSHHCLHPTRQPSHRSSILIGHTAFCLGLFSGLSASFFLDSALSQKTMPRGKCLTRFRNLSTSLQAGPAWCIWSLQGSPAPLARAG